MEYRFNASEWVNLSAGERIKRCRILAYEASELGRSAKTVEMKRMYLELSQNWQKLAGMIERETATESGSTEQPAPNP